MIWYCTGWTTSLLLLARIALCAPAKEREVERGSGAQSGKTPFHFRFSPSNGATSVGGSVWCAAAAAAAPARLWLRQGTHFMQMNSRPINILFQLCLPLSLSLSLSLSLCSVFSLRVFHSLYFEGGRRRKWSSLHLRDLQLSRFLFSLLTKWHSPCTTG